MLWPETHGDSETYQFELLAPTLAMPKASLSPLSVLMGRMAICNSAEAYVGV